MFYQIKEPPQWLLDGLYREIDKNQTCHDCGATKGMPHIDGCDVARCLKTKGQRLMCNCGECGEDIWTGMWPGIQEAYEEKLVCFDTATGKIMFDLNAVALKNERKNK